MKIALLSSLYPPDNVGGTEKAVCMLAETLKAEGLEVFVIALHAEETQRVDEVNGIRVYRLPVDNLYVPWWGEERPNALQRLRWHLRDRWNRAAASRVQTILELERPDVLHTNSVSGFSVAVWDAAKRLGIATVHTLHDYYALCVKTTLYKNKQVCTSRCLDCKLLTANRRTASSMVDGVAAVSHAVLERHRQEGYFPASQQSVIYNIQQPGATAQNRESSTFTFGFIGRVTEDKGIEVLLEAFSALQGEQLRLKIAGRCAPAYLAGLQARFQDDRIEWLGYVSSDSFFSQVDVVVIPSAWAEPLGYTAIEALFAGRSVIASDIGGLREIASLAPLHQLVEAGNADALAKAMQNAVVHGAEWKLPRRAAETTLALFSAATIAQEYRNLYQAVTTEA